MKKLSAILLALCLVVTSALPALANDDIQDAQQPTQEQSTEDQTQQVQPALVNSSVLSTKTGGLVVGANATSIEKGKQFTVTFNKDNFNWSQGTSGQYAIGSFLPSWVKMSDSNFIYAGAWVDAATGNVTVAFTANQAYPQGTTVTVSLDSSLVGAVNNVTAAYTGSITVTDPAAQQPQTQQPTTPSESSSQSSSSSSESSSNNASLANKLNDLKSSSSESSSIGDTSPELSSPAESSNVADISPELSSSVESSNVEDPSSGSSSAAESSNVTESSTPNTQEPAVTTPNPGAITGTQGGGTLGTVPSSVKMVKLDAEKGNFKLTFNADNFTSDDTGSFSIGVLSGTGVVKFSPSNAPFTGTVIDFDPSTGNATVNVIATGAYDAPLEVYLQAGSGAETTHARIANVLVVDNSTTSTITKTKAGGAVPSANPSGEVSMNTGDTIVFKFPADNFVWNTNTGAKNAKSLTDTKWIKLSSGITIGTDFSVEYSTPTGSEDVYVTLTALRAKNYSGLQVWLQDNVSGGNAATTKSAAQKVTVTSSNAGKISGITSNAELGGTHSGAYLNGKAISGLSGLEVNYDDEILIPLYAGFFTWTGETPYARTPVTTSQLNSGKVKVGVSNKKGNSIYDKPEIVSKDGQAYIKVKFVEGGSTVKDIDFEMTVYLSVSSKRHTDSQVVIDGTLVHEVIDVDDDEDYIDISDGSVVEPSSYVRNVELYLGNGVSVTTNLYSGKKYSGTAKIDIGSADEKILDTYPSIELILSLRTTNLSGSGSKVTLDYDENYYVYNQDGKYIGRSSEKLPYASKYYLSTTKIDLSSKDPEEVDPPAWVGEVPIEDKPIVNKVPPNANDVPGTGR